MSTTQYDIEYCQSLSLTPILDFGFVVVVYNSCSSLCIDAPSAKKKSGRFCFRGVGVCTRTQAILGLDLGEFSLQHT